MTRWLVISTVLLANLLLGATFTLRQDWVAAGACLILAAFWSIFNLRHVPRLASLCFTILSLLAVYSLLAPGPALLSFMGLWVGLAAWDLSDFSFRLKSVVPPDAAARLEKMHLLRLAAVLGIGLAAGLAGLFIHFELSFIPALLLGLLAFAALAFAVRSVKKETKD